MVRAVFFDMGGTLDGDGLHWLDRFVDLYARAGLDEPREVIRAAFDAAERRAGADEQIQSAALDRMVDCHVQWQFDEMRRRGVTFGGRAADTLKSDIVNAFVEPVRNAAIANRLVLESLHAKGLALGVVSNGCGNVQSLCDDLGYSPWLSLVIDSRVAGLFKPDPALFRHACERMHLPPSSIIMVGDSFDRDIRPARAIGMKTAWLQGRSDRPCPDPSLVDITLRTLADLPGELAEKEARDVA
ncbi:MAG TPA: HAD family hydrolase [Vicinamibacterales bacterium]|jgi:putative hydrolase of the HAD superfamily|nr:HAD family hydrolase [Vicinamibacterales bacterium]